jgi:hypothetical protein
MEVAVNGYFKRRLSSSFLAKFLARVGVISAEVAVTPKTPLLKEAIATPVVPQKDFDPKIIGKKSRGRRTPFNQVRGHQRGRNEKHG